MLQDYRSMEKEQCKEQNGHKQGFGTGPALFGWSRSREKGAALAPHQLLQLWPLFKKRNAVVKILNTNVNKLISPLT